MGYSMASAHGRHGHNDRSIVRLVETVRQDRSPGTLEALWRCVFALPSWHLLVHGMPPAVRPGTMRIDGKAFLLAFTTRAAAEAFLRGPSRGAHPANGILELAPDAAVATMATCPENSVYGVLFDEGPSGFYAPLHAMAEMRRHFAGEGGAGPSCFCGIRGVDFDALVDSTASPPDDPRDAVTRALLAMPDWWFVCDPDRPDAVAVSTFRGQPAVLAFTDDWQALRGIERFELTGADDAVLLLQLGTEEAIGWLGDFLSRGLRQVAFNAAGRPIVLDIERLPELLARHPPPA